MDRVCIVTAATGGLASDIARRLARDGWKLALLGLPDGTAETLAKEVGGIGITGSVTESDDLKKIVDLTMAKWGRVDGVVNSTGHAPNGDVLELKDSDWQKGYELLLMNVVRMSRLVTPIMEKQKSGVFVNISTATAVEPSHLFPISSVIRAGLGAYCKLYSNKYGPVGIRMNNLLPGLIDNFPKQAEHNGLIPLRRLGTVAEISDVVAFLLSDGAGYITGQNIRADGGFTRPT